MIKYIVYGNHHPLCEDLSLFYHGGSIEFHDFCRSRKLRESDGIAIAFDNGKRVGFFRFDIDAVDGTLYSNGTFVEPTHRRFDIAFKLWVRVLAKKKPNKVVVVLTSPEAEKLISKVKKHFLDIEFFESVQRV